MINAKDFQADFGSKRMNDAFAEIFAGQKPILTDAEKGRMDCFQGKPHKSGMSEEYTEAYRKQYAKEQQASYWSQR